MITDAIERTLFLKLAPRRVHHVKPVPYAERNGLVREVYDQMVRGFTLAPPVTLHSAVPQLLAGVWSVVSEAYLSPPAGRIDREVVAAAVSRRNGCPFCVDVHTMTLHGASAHDVAEALVRGDDAGISDARLRAIAEWAAATRSPGAAILSAPPFSSEHAPQILGTAVAFHYINRVVNVFLDESPVPLASSLSVLKRPMRRMGGGF